MFLDAVIYLRNPLEWNRQVHQVLGSTVGDLMSTKVHTCSASTSLPQAARLLNDRRIQRLFVVDAQGLTVGVLTRGDVVRALAQATT
jgi:predicted transcriptional regulator